MKGWLAPAWTNAGFGDTETEMTVGGGGVGVGVGATLLPPPQEIDNRQLKRSGRAKYLGSSLKLFGFAERLKNEVIEEGLHAQQALGLEFLERLGQLL